MSAPRLWQVISPARPSSICASPAPRKSRTIASRRTGNMRSQPRRVTSAGPTTASSSSTRISASPARARLRARVSHASPPKLRLPASVSCSASRCHGSLAIMPIGTGLIDLAGLTDTLIGDADGIYHPALFNDRLLLGLKGTMSEAEVHVLRARLNGGIRNKAARGELRRGLPVGFVWGEADGEVRFHRDEAVVTAIRNVFARFAETGSARRVWLWFRSEGLTFPLQMHQGAEIRWVEASYTAIHHVLTNPVYAGAYVYGKTRQETTLDAAGARRKRIRHLPRSEWQVLIQGHHEGFIDWQPYAANKDRIARNTRPRPHNDPSKAGGAVREGSALLQSLASCGHCGRRLHTHYRGRSSAPGYHCPGKILVEGRGVYCLNIGGIQIDEAVTRAFIAALEPAKLAATLAAAERLEADRETHAQAMASRRRAGELRSEPRRAPLPCRRSRQPAGRSWPRTRVGGGLERTRSRQGQACTPRTGASTRAFPRGARPSARARTRSCHRLARRNHHAA